jgi:hypothetical protein
MGSQNNINAILGRTTSVTTASYTVQPTDVILAVSTSSATTITLPTPTTSNKGRVLTIKDVTGSASTHNITISATSLVDGASTLLISTNYGFVQIYSDGVTYYTEVLNNVTLPFAIVVFATDSSVTYTPSAGTSYAIVECIGGGGAGGGAVVTSGSNLSVGSGGGAGGYIRFLATAAQLGSSVVITIGTGGAGVNATTGGNGGNTVFGSLATANGGSGGTTSTSSVTTSNVGGAGGSTSFTGVTPLLQITGQSGGYGVINSGVAMAFPGYGGSTPFGVGGIGGFGYLNLNGTAGSPYGAGGSGGMNGTLSGGGSPTSGGAGAVGAVVVKEYHF